MLKARVVTALCLVAFFLMALFTLPNSGWILFVTAITALAAWEWAGLWKFAPIWRIAYAFLSAALGLVLAVAAFGWPDIQDPKNVVLLSWVYASGAAFWLVIVPLWLVRRRVLGGAWLAVVVGWLVLLPASASMIHLRGISPWLLLAAMAAVWVADIAAFFAGRAYGRHKLAPAISPGKTWEGACGAVVAVLVYGIAVAVLSRAVGMIGSALMALGAALVLFTAVSIVGDLFESLVKRQVGVKDSGNLLPGHGGVLDRIDSLTSTLPLVGMALLWCRG